jgi:hypothetical protein
MEMKYACILTVVLSGYTLTAQEKGVGSSAIIFDNTSKKTIIVKVNSQEDYVIEPKSKKIFYLNPGMHSLTADGVTKKYVLNPGSILYLDHKSTLLANEVEFGTGDSKSGENIPIIKHKSNKNDTEVATPKRFLEIKKAIEPEKKADVLRKLSDIPKNQVEIVVTYPKNTKSIWVDGHRATTFDPEKSKLIFLSPTIIPTSDNKVYFYDITIVMEDGRQFWQRASFYYDQKRTFVNFR